jgi:hypothetical protein
VTSPVTRDSDHTMNPRLQKLFAIAASVKNPLAVSGLGVMALYLVYRQLLSLKVFVSIGAHPTFLVLQNVIDKLFWLALTAVVLGVSSYVIALIAARHSHPLASGLRILDSSLDPRDSPYEERLEAGKRVIRPKNQLPGDSSAPRGQRNDDQH